VSEAAIRRAHSAEAELRVDLWLRSVRVTHTFLSEADIQSFLPFVREYLSSLETDLWVLCTYESDVIGFMGMSDNKMESLFIDPQHLRCGGGRRLVEFAKRLHGELTVDVNEQNPAACRFYAACGFIVEGRSPLDGMGKPFPLLHLRLK